MWCNELMFDWHNILYLRNTDWNSISRLLQNHRVFEMKWNCIRLFLVHMVFFVMIVQYPCIQALKEFKWGIRDCIQSMQMLTRNCRKLDRMQCTPAVGMPIYYASALCQHSIELTSLHYASRIFLELPHTVACFTLDPKIPRSCCTISLWLELFMKH